MFEALPEPVRALLDVLAGAGHEAVLVGGCVRDQLRGAAVHDWDVATSATPAELLALFPRAVPIGLRFGTVMVPTPAGPVDVTQYRGATLADDLARRDFTLDAIAWDPQRRLAIDPHGGSRDLAAHRLRAVGRAEDRLAEDPLRALRAARIAAELGLEVDATLEAALPAVAGSLGAVAGERIGGELLRLLGAAGRGPGRALLRRTRLETVLVPEARADALRVIESLEPDPVTRLAAWLRGSPVSSLLARWRAPARAARRSNAARHPSHRRGAGDTDASVRRLRGVAPAAMRGRGAMALREAECAAGSVADPARVRARLADLRAALARTHAHALARSELALSGQQAMECLGLAPGPEVGAALRHLLERVLEDPSENTPERLRARLLAWAAGRRAAASS
jgi:tRNA nucleotidyltransferase (CCA-adding enzyme)